MQLLDIPEELFYGNIWPLLEWNELLRMRRVSKKARDLVSLYILGQPRIAPEIEINETDKKLEDYLEMPVISTKLYINNNISGSDYFNVNTDAVTSFLTRHGEKIVAVKMNNMCQFLMGNERKFFTMLPNLTTLVVENWTGMKYHCSVLDFNELNRLLGTLAIGEKSGSAAVNENDRAFPPSFRNLKSVSIGMETGSADNENMKNVSICTIELTELMSDALHVALPFNYLIDAETSSVMQTVGLGANERGSMFLLTFIRYLLTRIKQRKDANQTVLKSYSFEHFFLNDHGTEQVVESDRYASLAFSYLCDLAIKCDIQLKMVNSAWLQGTLAYIPQKSDVCTRKLGDCITSVVNLHPTIVSELECQNLEKIVIKKTSNSGIPNGPVPHPVWPLLNTLEIVVDSTEMDETIQIENVGENHRIRTFPKQPTNLLFDIFFGAEAYRPALLYLSVKFDVDISEIGSRSVFRMIFPKTLTEDIARSCPYLKKLALLNWPGTNLSLTILWANLDCLEEISFDRCLQLGNSGFVGHDVENPVFLRLKNLRKLELKGLDKMPRVTDTLFKLVLANMSICELILTSDARLVKITQNGIAALLRGKFSESIRKFPFQGWSLKSCNKADFETLASRFRSSHML